MVTHIDDRSTGTALIDGIHKFNVYLGYVQTDKPRSKTCLYVLP